MEISKSKTITDELKKYDYLAQDNDYISITEWPNGDGYVVDINGRDLINMTHGMLEAINHLIKTLEYDGEHENK